MIEVPGMDEVRLAARGELLLGELAYGFEEVEAPLPEDLAMCLDLLRAARREAAISSARAPASSRPP